MSSEYGWLDDVVLDLRVSRLRQIVDAIRIRRKISYRQQVVLTEWSTRNITHFISRTIQDSKGSASSQKEAAKLAFPWDDKKVNKALDTVVPGDTDVDADDAFAYLETGDLSAADRNAGKDISQLFKG